MNDWMEAFSQQNQIIKVMETNAYTKKYGLTLSEQDAVVIMQERRQSLIEQRRVEFGEGIMPKIIYEFCDSDYITQSEYVETLIRLQNTFYLFKNEMMDEITDDELLHFMKEQFETICYGDIDYLEGTCLSNFARAIRAGYRGHRRTDGHDQYAKFDEVARWDYDLYVEALKDLFWE